MTPVVLELDRLYDTCYDEHVQEQIVELLRKIGRTEITNGRIHN